MNRELNIQRLVSYLTNNCSIKEQTLVEEWINMSNENMMMFDDFKKVWESTNSNNESCSIDIDKAWVDFKKRARFDETITVETVEKTKKFSIRSFSIIASRVAALMVIVFGLYLLFDKGTAVESQSYTAAIAQVDSPFVLPDGSSITMNKGAKVDYPENFPSDIRNVDFKGEAFFDIAHNPDKPMVIACDNVRVKILGTSFNLCNCADSEEITVYLETGKVLFYSIDDDGSVLEQIILNPGQKGVYNKNTGLITKHQFNDNNHLAWKTGALDFVNAPLPDVIKVLENTYKIDVKSDILIDDYMLTARFNNETPESIFESLQIIYGLNYEIKDDSILIY